MFFIVLYRHPHQNSDEIDLFLDRLQLTVDHIKSLKPHCKVITGDFNCRIIQDSGDMGMLNSLRELALWMNLLRVIIFLN